MSFFSSESSVASIQGIPAERIYLDPLLSDAETAELKGSFLSDSQIKTVIGRSCDVFCKKTGKTLFKFRKNVISPEVSISAYNALHKAGEVSIANRAVAAGPISDEEIAWQAKKQGGIRGVRVSPHQYRVLYANGNLAKTVRGKLSNGSIVGYFGKTARIPYCRMTAYTEANFSKFTQAFPIVRIVDRFYEALMPEAWGKQTEAVIKSTQDFIIPNTSYSTITVNKNFRTALHYDAGDFEEGFGNLVVIRKGNYKGCYTSFPQYGAGVDAETGDILLMDVHQLHGNTPRIDITPNSVRLALVMYFRDDIQQCGTASEELSQAVKRRDI